MNASSDVSDTVMLVRKAQEGNRDALNTLFRRFAPYVERIIGVVLGTESLANMDDCVQECLVKAFSSLGTFGKKGEENNFRAWLSSCARSVVCDDQRRWKRIKRGAGRERPFSAYGSTYLTTRILPASPGKTPSEVAMEYEERIEQERRLVEAFRSLEKHRRMIILMRDYCEYSFKEIADRLHIESLPRLRKSYERAIKALRKKVS